MELINRLDIKVPGKPSQDMFGPPTWTGATSESHKDMGGIFHRPEGQDFVCSPPIGNKTPQRLLIEVNPEGYLTINDIKVAAYVSNLHTLAPSWHHWSIS